MDKIFRVARNEYLNVVRTKAFLFSVFLMPVLMFGAIGVQAYLQDKVDVDDRTFAVVDGTGALFTSIERAARARNEAATKDGKQTRSYFTPVRADGDTAALSDQVRKGKIFAYIRIPQDAIERTGEIAYHSQSPTYRDLAKWIQQVLVSEIRKQRIAAAGLDPALVRRLNERPMLRSYGLAERTESGGVKKAQRVNQAQTYMIPVAAMFLLFMLVMTSAPLLLNNVLEEKMQRIAEILVSSVSPFELFLGKLVGMVFVSWTLSILYLGGVAFLAHRFGFSSAIPPSLYAWFLFFQLLALFIFGSIFSAFGAAASEIRDAQSMMMPAMILVMMPMFVMGPVLNNPNSGFAVAVSLIPFATPFLLLLRIAIPPGPATWEIVAGVAGSMAFTLMIVWVASRIFRVGILAQGQTPSFRKMLAWVVSK